MRFALPTLLTLAVLAGAHRIEVQRRKTFRTSPVDAPAGSVVKFVDEERNIEAAKKHWSPYQQNQARLNSVFGAFSKSMGAVFVLREHGGEDVLQMPERMTIPLQDPKDLVSPLLKKLDAKCGERFQKTLDGEAMGMHGLDLKSKNLGAKCEEKFDGKLCSTKATIRTTHEDKGTSNDVKARFVMDGDSCIPKECVTSDNLAALSEFMRARATTMGEKMGNDLDIALTVDCTSEEDGAMVVSPPKSGAASALAPLVALLVTPLAVLF